MPNAHAHGNSSTNELVASYPYSHSHFDVCVCIYKYFQLNAFILMKFHRIGVKVNYNFNANSSLRAQIWDLATNNLYLSIMVAAKYFMRFAMEFRFSEFRCLECEHICKNVDGFQFLCSKSHVIVTTRQFFWNACRMLEISNNIRSPEFNLN